MNDIKTTDLAIEIANGLQGDLKKELENGGLCVKTSKHPHAPITTTIVEITNQEVANQFKKPIGIYTTIESPLMKENNPEVHEEIIEEVVKALVQMLPKKGDIKVLVVGLGNRFATPDTLGPHVAGAVLVTRHIKEQLPEEMMECMGELSSFAPGVMGLTGIETSEIVKGVAEHVKPHCILAVDALAARSAERINTTIQITNTGIAPGAGVGNKRSVLNEEEIGYPVIAIGVPTVVDAVTLVGDLLEDVLDKMNVEDLLSFKSAHRVIENTLMDQVGSLFVTPKDMDQIMKYLTHILSTAINLAVHPKMEREELKKWLS